MATAFLSPLAPSRVLLPLPCSGKPALSPPKHLPGDLRGNPTRAVSLKRSVGDLLPRGRRGTASLCGRAPKPRPLRWRGVTFPRALRSGRTGGGCKGGVGGEKARQGSGMRGALQACVSALVAGLSPRLRGRRAPRAPVLRWKDGGGRAGPVLVWAPDEEPGTDAGGLAVSRSRGESRPSFLLCPLPSSQRFEEAPPESAGDRKAGALEVQRPSLFHTPPRELQFGAGKIRRDWEQLLLSLWSGSGNTGLRFRTSALQG